MMNQLFIRGYKQWRDDSMIREIENRRSIRKYKPDELDRKLIEEIKIGRASCRERVSSPV